jgi:hypothetical protein
MHVKTKLSLLFSLILFWPLVLFWLFNLCAFNFLLANPRFEGNIHYEQRFYFLFPVFIIGVVVELAAIWKAAKAVKVLRK